MKSLRNTIEQHLYEQEMQKAGYEISTVGNEENDFYDVYINKHGIIVNVIPNSNNSNPEASTIAKNLLQNTKGEHFKESIDLTEAPNRKASQGIVSAGKNIQSLVINLKQGSALNKRFNKDLDTNYDSEFKNMHKSILNVEKIWSRIEDDFFIGESIEESSDLTEADKISFPFAWGYIDSVLKDFKVHAKKAKLGLEQI